MYELFNIMAKKPTSIKSPSTVAEINIEAQHRLNERRKDNARDEAYLFGKPLRLKEEPNDVVFTKAINRNPRYF